MSAEYPRRDSPPSSRRSTDAQLLNIVEDLEAVDWVEVPELTKQEVATFVQRLEEARAQL